MKNSEINSCMYESFIYDIDPLSNNGEIIF